VSKVIACPSESYAKGPYPERADSREFAIDRWLRATSARFLSGLGKWDRSSDRFIACVERRGDGLQGLPVADLQSRVRRVALDLRRRGLQFDAVVEAFALIREVSAITLGKRHYSVQLRGGYALIRGHIAEMSTGEGKTLTATLAAATAALGGMPVHVVTVNDYLAARDAEEMEPLYRALGLSVGVIQQDLSPEQKRANYAADITYCTNKDLGFDYLRDRLQLKDWPSRSRINLKRMLHGEASVPDLLLRGLHFAIVDEADSVLIDEARTPLIISGNGESYMTEDIFKAAIAAAEALTPDSDYELAAPERVARLKPAGIAKVRKQCAGQCGIRHLESVWTDLVTQALTALHLYHKDWHYLVRDEKIHIIDEYTGRLMSDRTWEYGLHQLIEVKEQCALSPQKITLARITYQRFFRRYLHLSGMTGTGREVAAELWSVYRLKTSKIPTYRPVQRIHYPPRVLATQEGKWRAVVESVRAETRERGRPVLIGTCSVAASEHLSELLTQAGLEHRLLNARQDAEEAQLVAAAGQAGVITVATNMAGRGTDIKLVPGVKDRGGLHIILTEFSESARIDRQLYGRAGRQGDPGSAEAIVAVEDDLFRHHLPGFMRVFLRLAVVSPGWIRVFLSLAQYRAERKNARIREQTLVSDRKIDRMLAFAGKESS